ncbi:SHE4 [Malassezia furfur]|nr:SHE4 [Malassezia furfur]
MDDVVARLLDVLRRGTPAAGDAEILQSLAKLDVSEASALAQQLRDAAQHDTVQVLVALHVLTLVQAALAQRVLEREGLLHDLLAHAQDTQTRCAMAHMLAGAASQAPVRKMLAGDSDVQAWLARYSSDAPIVEVGDDAAACVDLVRIKLAIESDASKGTFSLPQYTCVQLFARLRATAVHASSAADPGLLAFDAAAAARADALEGMYYLVRLPALRDVLCNDRPLLEALARLLLVQQPASGTLQRSSVAFVIVSLLNTACAYAAPRTDEQRRIEALRRSAARGAAPAPEPPVAPADAARRARAVVEAGCVPPLVALALRTSSAVDSELRRTLSALLLSLVTEQNTPLRGRLLQLGVGRAVVALCKDAYAACAERAANADVSALQALAKLCISTDPALLFRQDGATEQGVQYVAALFFVPQGTLLQLFEAAMALTNLASVSPALAGAVARAPPRAPRDAEHSTHDEPMVRRALIELLCNLVQDEATFAEWSGEAEDTAHGATPVAEGGEFSEEPVRRDEGGAVALRLHTARGRLQLLVSLSDLTGGTPDATAVALALAASGTLATLTSSPAACARLLSPTTDAVLGRMLMPECTLPLVDAHQLALRAMVMAANLVQYVNTRPAGAARAAMVVRMRASAMVAACRAYVAENAAHAATRRGDDARLASLRQQALTMGMDVLHEAQKLA